MAPDDRISIINCCKGKGDTREQGNYRGTTGTVIIVRQLEENVWERRGSCTGCL